MVKVRGAGGMVIDRGIRCSANLFITNLTHSVMRLDPCLDCEKSLLTFRVIGVSINESNLSS